MTGATATGFIFNNEYPVVESWVPVVVRTLSAPNFPLSVAIACALRAIGYCAELPPTGTVIW